MKRQVALALASISIIFCLLALPALGQDTLPQLVKKVQPAVVTVIVYDAKGKVTGLGSGFFIDPEGRFLTNYHVLKDMARAEVKTCQGRRLPVIGMVAQDQNGDLAIAATNLRGERVPFLTFSRTTPEVGERVAVVGSPLGLEQTLSEGVVSAVRQVSELGKILQITAPISSGSSGSPVVNMKGEVVGVATFQIVKGQNLNFAVASSRALALKQRAAELPALAATPPPVRGQNPARSPAREAVDRGQAYFATGQYEQAVAAFQESIRLQPGYSGTWCLLGRAYQELRRDQEAVAAFKEALRLKPDLAPAWLGLGISYGDLGRFGEAAAAFQESVRLEPDHAGSHFALGAVLAILGNRSAALEEYKILQRLDPEAAEALFKAIYPSSRPE